MDEVGSSDPLRSTNLLRIQGRHYQDAAVVAVVTEKRLVHRGVVPELEFLCLGREFEIRSRSGKPGEKLVEHQPVISQDKVVDGKYLISEFQPENTPSPIYNVVTYDDSATVYRQWTLFPGGKVVESLGLAYPKSRSITWLYFETPYGPNTQSGSIGLLTDDGGSWREILRDGSKVVLITERSIRKIK